MADTAKSQVAIEDVLSSIRRLVAEDHGANATRSSPQIPKSAGSVASNTAKSDRSAPKLVLTSAHRLSETDAPDGVIAVQDEDVASNTAPEAVAPSREDAALQVDSSSAWSPEDRLANWGDLPNATMGGGGRFEVDDIPQPDGVDAGMADGSLALPGRAADDDDWHDESRDGFAPDEVGDEGAGPGHVAELIALDSYDALVDGSDAGPYESETGDADWPDTMADQALRTLAEARSIASVDAVAAPAEATADIVADMPETGAGSIWSRAAVGMAAGLDRRASGLSAVEGEDACPETGTGSDAIEPDLAGFDGQDVGMADDDATAVVPVFSRNMTDGAERDATQDAAASPIEEAAIQVQKDADTDPVAALNAATRVHVSDHGLETTASVPGEDAAPVSDTAREYAEDLGDGGNRFTFPEMADGLLDEDTLRDIVAEVVREELRGVLGQRITRNVRKMVRREIRLALAAEDLD